MARDSVSAIPRIPQTVTDWPDPLDAGAFGVLGRVVEALDGQSEADPTAVIFQLLSGFGCYLGERHWVQVDEDRHTPRLWVLLIGNTSSRKGLSFGISRSFMAGVDEDWTKHQVAAGLASGEALVQSVRDPDVEGEDPGAPDSRLWVVEPEFSTVLRISRREGSTLSGVLRSFYDSGTAQIRRSAGITTATDASVSLVGHITKSELLRELRSTDLTGGLVNRFALVLCRRQGDHPEGGRLPAKVRNEIVTELSKSVTWANKLKPTEVKRDAEAKALWATMYPILLDRGEDAVGFATSRAAAITLRLSLLIALLDRSTTIKKSHLRAASDLWAYADHSAHLIFGDRVGDTRSDKILAAIKAAGDAGLTRASVNDVLGGHASKEDLDELLGDLIRAGKIVAVSEKSPKGGHHTVYMVNPGGVV
ncbi:MAG: DUF3987 domain-containing protein [Actinomycetes bacterium]